MLSREEGRVIHTLPIRAALPEREGIEALLIPSRHADHDGAPPILQRGDAARQVSPGDALDDEIHAFAAGLGLDSLHEVLLDVIDGDVGAEISLQARKLCVIGWA